MEETNFIDEEAGESLYDQVRACWLERNWDTYGSHEERLAAFDERWSNVQGFMIWAAEQGAVVADPEMANAGARLDELLAEAFPTEMPSSPADKNARSAPASAIGAKAGAAPRATVKDRRRRQAATIGQCDRTHRP